MIVQYGIGILVWLIEKRKEPSQISKDSLNNSERKTGIKPATPSLEG